MSVTSGLAEDTARDIAEAFLPGAGFAVRQKLAEIIQRALDDYYDQMTEDAEGP